MCLGAEVLQNFFTVVFRILSNIYDRAVSKIVKQLSAINYFHKKLHHRCLTGSLMHLCIYVLLFASKFYS